MPVPSDINSQIALRRGWTWHEEGEPVTYQVGIMWADDVAHWQNPDGEWAINVPDSVGTLEGVSLMLQELQERKVEEGAIQYDWAVRWSALFQIWDVWAEDAYNTGERLITAAATKEAGLGEAVGAAWVNQHEEMEATQDD